MATGIGTGHAGVANAMRRLLTEQRILGNTPPAPVL